MIYYFEWNWRFFLSLRSWIWSHIGKCQEKRYCEASYGGCHGFEQTHRSFLHASEYFLVGEGWYCEGKEKHFGKLLFPNLKNNQVVWNVANLYRLRWKLHANHEAIFDSCPLSFCLSICFFAIVQACHCNPHEVHVMFEFGKLSNIQTMSGYQHGIKPYDETFFMLKSNQYKFWIQL